MADGGAHVTSKVHLRKGDGSIVDPATAQGQASVRDAINAQVGNAPITEIPGAVEALAEGTTNDLITHTAAGGEGLRGVHGSSQRAGFFRYSSMVQRVSRDAPTLLIGTGRCFSPASGNSTKGTQSSYVSAMRAKAHPILRGCY